MEVRVQGLKGEPVAIIGDFGQPDEYGTACDFCGLRAPKNWGRLAKEDVPTNVPWNFRYAALDASAILEVTPDELIIMVTNERLRRLPSMVACNNCEALHERRLRKELAAVGLAVVC
ncbi:hypothetical protein A2936_00480 [Candidatus Uhrbacteria bacterium RIFCSPLOWO2_01_FULL_47_25]|uniref:Uncharacterized protein n=1 Tax=Candidatus Uhrbacteria bacterium RIFCSPLOWO2_01_FULL_47_25 TaxID=1802402 RepID=A0A1F7UQT7_9BACT|nr:MAG: hypothetical protein A2936_00480 [Candidatus Uhrbacteria bacterium RIFCSPLOWO2_01_FULL_47_25]